MQSASARSLSRVATARLRRSRCRPVRFMMTVHNPLDATRFRGTAAEGLVNLNMGEPIHPPKYSRKNKTFVDLEVKASTLGPSAGVGVFVRQKIGRNTLLTEYGVDVVEAGHPRTRINCDYHMGHVEDHLTILGEPWTGQVPSGLVPYTTPLGHLVNDPACLPPTLLREHWAAFKGMRTLMERITHMYEVPSIVGANVMKGFDVNEGRMMVVSTKDIEEGAELFLHYGWDYWMDRAMGQAYNDHTIGAWGRASVCSWFAMTGRVPPHVVFLEPTSQELLVVEDMKPRRASEEECRTYQQRVLGLDSNDHKWWDACIQAWTEQQHSDGDVSKQLVDMLKKRGGVQGLGERDKLMIMLSHVMEG